MMVNESSPKHQILLISIYVTRGAIGLYIQFHKQHYLDNLLPRFDSNFNDITQN